MSRILRRRHVQDTFEVNKTSLQSILMDIGDGRLQLPNLQRSWRWPDENIVALLESIAINHPVGAIMQIEFGGELKFQHRGFEGTSDGLAEQVTPSHLMLDGQQRCTSLFQACFSKAPVKVDSDKKARYHRYFFDMTKVLYEDVPMSDAIISLLVDWRGIPIRRDGDDYTNETVQFEKMIFPVNQMFDFPEWDQRFHTYWDAEHIDRKLASDARQTARDFHAVIVRAFTSCMVPVIMLRRGMSVAGVCKVYENLNSRGVPLDAFDLLIAHFAAEGYCLRTDWYGPRGKSGTKGEVEAASHGILDALEPKQFMQAVTLAHGLSEGIAIGIEKDDLLSLKLDAYVNNRGSVVAGFAAACDFLREEKVAANTAPTTLYIICLAAMFAHLGEKGSDPAVREKLHRWLWTSALCSSFAAHSTRTMAEAVPEVVNWLLDLGPEPSTIVNPIVTYGDIKTAKKGGNVHRAIIAALIRSDARDPSTGLAFALEDGGTRDFTEVSVFPSSWHKDNDAAPDLVDSVVNKALVLVGKGGPMGKSAPSAAISTMADEESASSALRSQGIETEALARDDFDSFFAARLEYLASVIEGITGRRVISDDDILALQARAGSDDPPVSEYLPQDFLWRTSARGANVFLGVRDGKYVVFAGSVMSGDATPSLDERFVEERERLMASPILRQEDDDSWLLLEDYVSKSASHAYSVFVGQKAVGRIWKDVDGNASNPSLPEVASDEDVVGDVAAVETSETNPAAQQSNEPDESDGPDADGFRRVVEDVEAVIGDALVEEGRTRFATSSGKTVKFTKTAPLKDADYEFVTVRPQYFDSDYVVIWSATGNGWMIPSDKLRDFLECIPTTQRSSGAISWDPRVGKIDGQDVLWTNLNQHGGLTITPFSLTA